MKNIINIIKNTFLLCLITCVAGALLGGVYEVTKDARGEQEIKTKEKAYKKVIADAKSFDLLEYDSEQLEKYMKKKGISQSEGIVNEIVAAKDEGGAITGYAITVTSKEGYGGNIQFTVGILSDKTISGISILSISETAGLGMNAKNESFLKGFKGSASDSFEVVKTTPENDGQIAAISGATITTRAMVKGVNASKIVYSYIDENLKNIDENLKPDDNQATGENMTSGEGGASDGE